MGYIIRPTCKELKTDIVNIWSHGNVGIRDCCRLVVHKICSSNEQNGVVSSATEQPNFSAGQTKPIIG